MARFGLVLVLAVWVCFRIRAGASTQCSSRARNGLGLRIELGLVLGLELYLEEWEGRF
jgi:hypothetical protein